MSTDYSFVLNDLRERRKQIESEMSELGAEMAELKAAISAIEKIQVGKGAVKMSIGTNFDFVDMSFSDASRRLLEREEHPLTTTEIMNLLADGGLKGKATNPTNSLYSILAKTSGIRRDGQKWILSKWKSLDLEF